MRHVHLKLGLAPGLFSPFFFHLRCQLVGDVQLPQSLMDQAEAAAPEPDAAELNGSAEVLQAAVALAEFVHPQELGQDDIDDTVSEIGQVSTRPCLDGAIEFRHEYTVTLRDGTNAYGACQII